MPWGMTGPLHVCQLCGKILSGIIGEDLYQHLSLNSLLSHEQKGCGKKSRGTKDQLAIDKAILRDCKQRKTNAVIARVDYKKAYNSVPHSWIMKTLELGRAADNLKPLMNESMKIWKTQLTARGEDLGEMLIRRGIFQGDSLSPLLFAISMLPRSAILRESASWYKLSKEEGKINHLMFVDDLKLYGKNVKEINSLLQTVRVFSSDIGMDFGIKKCAAMIMKRGKLVWSEGIKLPDGRKIRSIGEEDDGYKYLGMLEVDDIMPEVMKTNMKEYT